jgi:hypothetical protein
LQLSYQSASRGVGQMNRELHKLLNEAAGPRTLSPALRARLEDVFGDEASRKDMQKLAAPKQLEPLLRIRLERQLTGAHRVRRSLRRIQVFSVAAALIVFTAVGGAFVLGRLQLPGTGSLTPNAAASASDSNAQTSWSATRSEPEALSSSNPATADRFGTASVAGVPSVSRYEQSLLFFAQMGSCNLESPGSPAGSLTIRAIADETHGRDPIVELEITLQDAEPGSYSVWLIELADPSDSTTCFDERVLGAINPDAAGAAHQLFRDSSRAPGEHTFLVVLVLGQDLHTSPTIESDPVSLTIP